MYKVIIFICLLCFGFGKQTGFPEFERKMFWILNVFIQWWSKPFYNANAVINQPPPLYLLQRSFLQITISARLFVHNYSDLHLYNKSFFALKFLPSFQFLFKTSEKCLKYFIYITLFILYCTCRRLIIFIRFL